MLGATRLRAARPAIRAGVSSTNARQLRFAPRTSVRPSLRSTAAVAHVATAPSTVARSLFTRAAPTPLARTRQLAYFILTLAGGAFAVTYYLDSRSGIHRWAIMPVLKAVTDPETAQKLAVKLLETGLAPKDFGTDDDILQTQLFGKTISNPIGLAAGFDKQAEAIDGLFDLGFGFIEIGSVTPEPQPGNPQPRYFRLTDDQASINRFGFNSEGHSVILGRLRDRIRRWLLHSTNVASLNEALTGSPEGASAAAQQLIAAHPKSNSAFVDAVGLPRSLQHGKVLAVNLGKNKTSKEESVDDYVKGVERLGPYADMIVINVSSPNTPGLRRLQRRGVLEDLLTQVVKARDEMVSSHINLTSTGQKVAVPLLVKIAPDLSEEELHDVADAAINSKIDGLVISNTTISRPESLRSSEHVRETGGLSGPPLKPLALKALQTVHRRIRGQLPIIGCGGITTGQDALDFAKAGASAVELYTSFGYQGVGLPRKIKDELTELLKAEGKTWKEVVGTGVKLSEVTTAAANDEVPMGLSPARDAAFTKTVASVKEELAGLRQDLGLSAPALAFEMPDREKDVAYYKLLEETHAALGLSLPAGQKPATSAASLAAQNDAPKTQGEKAAERAEALLQDPAGPNVEVWVEEKTKKVFGDSVRAKVAEAEDAAAARDFGKVDKRRIV
ncbi:Dihydroorotate dehydrogenase (quinone), mitochondrial [Thecaphora frezii]